MNERRVDNRVRTLKGAKVAFGDFRFTYDCVIRNQSDDGALVRTNHAAEVPDDFYLFDPQIRALRRAEVVWRRERDLGIRFTAAPVSVANSADPRHARFRFV